MTDRRRYRFIIENVHDSGPNRYDIMEQYFIRRFHEHSNAVDPSLLENFFFPEISLSDSSVENDGNDIVTDIDTDTDTGQEYLSDASTADALDVESENDTEGSDNKDSPYVGFRNRPLCSLITDSNEDDEDDEKDKDDDEDQIGPSSPKRAKINHYTCDPFVWADVRHYNTLYRYYTPRLYSTVGWEWIQSKKFNDGTRSFFTAACTVRQQQQQQGVEEKAGEKTTSPSLSFVCKKLNTLEHCVASLQTCGSIIEACEPRSFANDDATVRAAFAALFEHVALDHRRSMRSRLLVTEPSITDVRNELPALLLSLSSQLDAVSPNLFARYVVPLFVKACFNLARCETDARENERTTNIVGWCAAVSIAFAERHEIQMTIALLAHRWIVANCETLIPHEVEAMRDAFLYAREKSQICPHLCVALSCFARRTDIAEWEEDRLLSAVTERSFSKRASKIDQRFNNDDERFTESELERIERLFERRAIQFVRAARTVDLKKELEQERRRVEETRSYDLETSRRWAYDDIALLRNAMYAFARKAAVLYDEDEETDQYPLLPQSLQRIATYALLRADGFVAAPLAIPQYFERARRIFKGWMCGYAYSVEITSKELNKLHDRIRTE